ncbi:DUF2867 domain-containing protein [Streptomyces sp. MST-110588]|uniref:DUF2867 domain-containing protein n=1 Tax=Streptomyces sp. MST-110588 TaxID=2833628 RepID=UPI001F5DAF8F|nr:DUF2867 domain-containing protein [Streptomyces sp. MST-110588]UNO38606.1 DUF2867 domain-containing protein [Streptomyces sp. MST-110588]
MATASASPARVRRVEVPRALRAREDLAGYHYASAFASPVPDGRPLTPEQWARVTFETAPLPMRWCLMLGWTGVLGLRLGPKSSPRHVLGWRVTRPGPGSVTLEAPSRLVDAHNVVLVEDAQILWATTVRFKGRAGRVAWGVAAPVHHLMVPLLLRRALRSAAGRRRTAPGSRSAA